jgi:hypothetical protein
MHQMRPIPRLKAFRERGSPTESLLAGPAGISTAIVPRAEKSAAVFSDTIRALAGALGVQPADLTASETPGR